jgi:hypothetical protein
MIFLSSIIDEFESSFFDKYNTHILPSHKKALSAMKMCRSEFSPKMLAQCSNEDCRSITYIPHSCGHRSCPHCQHHESQQWIENQLNKLVPAKYYLLTFTLPCQFRQVTWQNQRAMYTLLFSCVKEVLTTFTKNDKKLRGKPGLMMVLHTHSRELAFHPHIHVVMPAASIDTQTRQWRVKSTKYLFDHEALAIVFKAVLLKTMGTHELPLPRQYPKKWVVDCKFVGKGKKAIIYLGKYLYKGAIQEKDILKNENGKVTFRFINSKTKVYQTKTVSGEEFLWLLLKHVLPKGFRRVRNFGFLNPRSKQLVKLLQYLLNLNPFDFLKKLKHRPKIRCKCCGSPMEIVQTMIVHLPLHLAMISP